LLAKFLLLWVKSAATATGSLVILKNALSEQYPGCPDFVIILF